MTKHQFFHSCQDRYSQNYLPWPTCLLAYFPSYLPHCISASLTASPCLSAYCLSAHACLLAYFPSYLPHCISASLTAPLPVCLLPVCPCLPSCLLPFLLALLHPCLSDCPLSVCLLPVCPCLLPFLLALLHPCLSDYPLSVCLLPVCPCLPLF
jgi:hypothetical protein